MSLYNKYDKKILKEQLSNEQLARTTVSFYRYVILHKVEQLRDQLYKQFDEYQVKGRIYMAREGINAQISVPEIYWEKFVSVLYSYPQFKDVPFKIAVQDDGKSFYKLKIKVRQKIVADGLNDDTFDVTNVGKHLD